MTIKIFHALLIFCKKPEYKIFYFLVIFTGTQIFIFHIFEIYSRIGSFYDTSITQKKTINIHIYCSFNKDDKENNNYNTTC